MSIKDYDKIIRTWPNAPLFFIFLSKKVNFLVKANVCNENQVDFYGTCLNVLKVFGQKNFQESSRDTVTASKIYHAAGVVVDKSVRPNRIYVADTGNNRILGFSSLGNCLNNPATACTNDLDCPGLDTCQIDGKKEAEIVIGQSDFISASCNKDNNLGIFKEPDKSTLCLMRFPLAANLGESWQRLNFDVDTQGNLYVPDVYNNRILKYNQPFSSDNLADFVWGQTDFNSNQVNLGLGEDQRNSNSLFISYRHWPLLTSKGVSVDSLGNIWVADSYNGRILRFSINSKEADLVLGQKDFTSFDRSMCQKPVDYSLALTCAPTLAKVDPETGHLYVLDESLQKAFEARILVFKPPFYNGMPAERIIIPHHEAPFQDGDYYLQATGFIFNTYQEGEYAAGKLWINMPKQY